MANVLVIDDDTDLYALLEEYFAKTGIHSENAPDGAEGLLRIQKNPDKWDIVILDVMLPGMDGMEVLRRLRAGEETRLVPVLMLTARGDVGNTVEGLEAGADDCLAKPFSLRELSARIKAILRRSATDRADRPGTLKRVDDLLLDGASFTVVRGGVTISLTPMDLRLLEVLLENPGTVVSREDLYRRVFEHEPFFQDRSLDMAISRLRKKLGPRSDGGERIRAAWGSGYIFLLPGASP
ncbi:MAG: response regulator transcription factor [Planctomycetes bacterium]|nr:response regulator transcription factor [Planctomycetota bacterium]